MSERFNYLQAWGDSIRGPEIPQQLSLREQYEQAETDYWDLLEKVAAVKALKSALANRLREGVS